MNTHINDTGILVFHEESDLRLDDIADALDEWSQQTACDPLPNNTTPGEIAVIRDAVKATEMAARHLRYVMNTLALYRTATQKEPGQ